jgi:hypothetical protein
MNFAELSKAVAEVSLAQARITDVAPGVHTISIDGEKVYLVNEKKEKFPISTRSLAAMRIVKSAADALKATNTADARETDVYGTLQDSIKKENIKVDENTKFTCVHRLAIQDTINNQPVYKNNNYKGYPEYVKSARKASALPSVSDEQKTARNNAFTEASEALRASGAKSTDAKHCLLMPVFTVS